MSILELILPTHARLATAGAGGPSTGGPVNYPLEPGSTAVPVARPDAAREIAEGQARLAKLEPWLTGLLNMIEEGDYRHALTFHDQIGQRLRVLERESRQDEAGIVRRD